MIIDSITHITPDGKWFHTEVDASEYRLLKEIEEEKITSAVVVALAGYIENKFVLEACRRNSGVLIAGGSFNPAAYSNAEEARKNFRAEFYQSEFKVLKLHPRLNQYDPLDPRCLAVLEEISSWSKKIPVWIDTLFHHKETILKKGIVESIHFLVNAFQEVDFVLLHGGGTHLLSVYEATRTCENALLDFSFALHRYKNTSLRNDYSFLISRYDKKIIFGSDFPEVSIAEAKKDYEGLFEGIKGLSNSEEKKQNIFYNNLQTLLNKYESI